MDLKNAQLLPKNAFKHSSGTVIKIVLKRDVLVLNLVVTTSVVRITSKNASPSKKTSKNAMPSKILVCLSTIVTKRKTSKSLQKLKMTMRESDLNAKMIGKHSEDA